MSYKPPKVMPVHVIAARAVRCPGCGLKVVLPCLECASEAAKRELRRQGRVLNH